MQTADELAEEESCGPMEDCEFRPGIVVLISAGYDVAGLIMEDSQRSPGRYELLSLVLNSVCLLQELSSGYDMTFAGQSAVEDMDVNMKLGHVYQKIHHQVFWGLGNYFPRDGLPLGGVERIPFVVLNAGDYLCWMSAKTHQCLSRQCMSVLYCYTYLCIARPDI